MTLLAVRSLDGPLPGDRPAIHADDEGFLRGRAVFETVRVYGGRPFLLAQHLERLRRSAEALRLPPPDLRRLAAAAADAVADAGAPDAVLRLLWTPGREGVDQPTGLALVSTLPPDLEERRARGLRLAALEWAPGRRLAATKSTSYAENLAAQDEARRRGYDDALLITSEGIVLEAPTANVWWREGHTLYTPALDQPILAGITRAALWQLAVTAGYVATQGRYTLERLLAADEVFLSSSIREVMPVTAVDETPIDDGTPGPAAAALQRELRIRATGEPDPPNEPTAASRSAARSGPLPFRVDGPGRGLP